MSTVTCGIFLYDAINKKLLVTKSYGSRKFEGYSIPKGHFDEDEDENYLDAALREFREECGQDIIQLMDGEENFKITKEFDLQPHKNVNKSLKSFLIIIHKDLSNINLECCSFFEKDGESYPEIASFHWMDLDESQKKLHYVQSELISKIVKLVK